MNSQSLVDKQKFAKKILTAIDACSTANGAGVILVTADGQRFELRGGPRTKYIYIVPKSSIKQSASTTTSQESEDGVWDRWGDAAMSCGSALAAGAAIYFSAGGASFFVGAMAVNSSALCGISIGKGIAHDDWKEFEKQGGSEYKTWLYLETAMNLADLFGGVKGAVTFVGGWKKAGQLEKLKKAIGNKKLTRKKLIAEIQKIDPNFQPVTKGKGFLSKHKIIVKGETILKDAQFVSLKAEERVKIFEAIADGLTIGGSEGTFSNLFEVMLIVGE